MFAWAIRQTDIRFLKQSYHKSQQPIQVLDKTPIDQVPVRIAKLWLNPDIDFNPKDRIDLLVAFTNEQSHATALASAQLINPVIERLKALYSNKQLDRGQVCNLLSNLLKPILKQILKVGTSQSSYFALHSIAMSLRASDWSLVIDFREPKLIKYLMAISKRLHCVSTTWWGQVDQCCLSALL